MTTAQAHPQLPDASHPRERLPSAVEFGPLEDGIMVCLAFLESDPDRFESAAVAWHARWCAAHPGVSFAESHAVLSALEALIGPKPAAAARELSAACRQGGRDELVSVFDSWLAGRLDAGLESAA